MKDLKFFSDSTLIGHLRVDSISGENNITVMETYALNDRSPDFNPADPNFTKKVALASDFKKLPSDFGAVVKFATDNSLILVMEDGANKAPKVPIVPGDALAWDTGATLTAGTEAVAYENEVEVTGGSGAYEYRLIAGSLPVGIVLGLDGSLTGTPTTAGASTFTVRATDLITGLTIDREFSLTIGS